MLTRKCVSRDRKTCVPRICDVTGRWVNIRGTRISLPACPATVSSGFLLLRGQKHRMIEDAGCPARLIRVALLSSQQQLSRKCPIWDCKNLKMFASLTSLFLLFSESTVSQLSLLKILAPSNVSLQFYRQVNEGTISTVFMPMFPTLPCTYVQTIQILWKESNESCRTM